MLIHLYDNTRSTINKQDNENIPVVIYPWREACHCWMNAKLGGVGADDREVRREGSILLRSVVIEVRACVCVGTTRAKWANAGSKTWTGLRIGPGRMHSQPSQAQKGGFASWSLLSDVSSICPAHFISGQFYAQARSNNGDTGGKIIGDARMKRARAFTHIKDHVQMFCSCAHNRFQSSWLI